VLGWKGTSTEELVSSKIATAKISDALDPVINAHQGRSVIATKTLRHSSSKSPGVFGVPGNILMHHRFAPFRHGEIVKLLYPPPDRFQDAFCPPQNPKIE